MADYANAEDKLATIRKRFEQDVTDEKDLRDEAETDLRFCAGDQWDDALKKERTDNGRPCLSFPRSHTFINQVANEARQNKTQISFVPAEEGDKDTAEVFEGIARHIHYDSSAEEAFETAIQYSASCGFGAFRLLTEYCDDESFDQDLKIVPVRDPFSVYGLLIPTIFGTEPDHMFVVEEIPLEVFKAEYPKSDVSTNASFFDDCVNKAGGWVGRETVRVAEYWYMEVTAKKLKKGDRERTILEKQVRCCKTNGFEILEEYDWPGKSIPGVVVLGGQLIVRGKPHLFSVIRYQRDPQKLINLYKSRIAETLGTAPIQPYMVAEGQIAGYEADWAMMNRKPTPVLQYRQEDIKGRPAGTPQRMVFEPPIAALSNAAAQEVDDMKATAGIFDASLGNQSNESSGIALARRQQQADSTNLHFADNLQRAQRRLGKMVAKLIPKIYDGKRAVRIIGVDEIPKIVKINQEFEVNGQPKRYDIGGDAIAKYDIVVNVGKSFSTKRLESFDMMGKVIQAAPQLLPMFGDILFRNSDIAGADQLAERFEKMLPPQLQPQKEGQQGDPAQMQQQMAALMQQHQQLTQALNEAQDQLDKQRVQTESKERIEMAKLELENRRLEFDVRRHMTTLDSQEAQTAFNAEVDLAKTGQQLNAQATAQDAEAVAQEIG